MSLINPNQATVSAVVIPAEARSKHSASLQLSLFNEEGDPIDISGSGGSVTNEDIFNAVSGPQGPLYKGSESVVATTFADALIAAFGNPTAGQVLGFNGTSVGWITP